MKPTLFIMRGLPGSGKSTKAKMLSVEHSAVIASADAYFTRSDGTYVYDKEYQIDAHLACRRKFLRAVADGANVIIDNTNIQRKEYLWYEMVAVEMGYRIRVVNIYPCLVCDDGVTRKCEPDSWKLVVRLVPFLANRTIHKVPEDVIRSMIERWED